MPISERHLKAVTLPIDIAKVHERGAWSEKRRAHTAGWKKQKLTIFSKTHIAENCYFTGGCRDSPCSCQRLKVSLTAQSPLCIMTSLHERVTGWGSGSECMES
jgi:hypothetical protein